MELELFLRIFVALILGVALGIERTAAHKTAGLRTYGLVSMGSALFVVISEIILKGSALNGFTFDPMRTASQIIVGIGFIGAGLIIFKEDKLRGLTTAVGLWIATGIGMAVGFGLYTIAILTTVLTLFVFTILWYIEQRVKDAFYDENAPVKSGK